MLRPALRRILTKRASVILLLLVVAGAIVNVAVVVLVVLLARDYVEQNDNETVTFFDDARGVVRWKTTVTKMSTLGLASSKRERWSQRLDKESGNGVQRLPLWASRLSVPLVEFVDGRMRLEERICVGRGWPFMAACFEILDEPHEVNGFRMVPKEGFQVRGVIDIGDPWDNGNVIPRQFPYQIAWPGFAINTLFYAAILWGLFAAPFALRRRRRSKRGLCPKCAYPIGTSDVCTECGQSVQPRRGDGSPLAA